MKNLHLILLAASITLTLSLSTTSTAATTANTCEANMSKKFRSVRTVLPRPPAHWVGDGFNVYPVFAHLAFKEELSPLLMFDYAAPKKFPAKLGAPLGVGQHPHRGFETVTIAFQGEVEHHDSTGNTGIIRSGDVQWMTAGRGIIHQEYHSKEFTQTGGMFEMCQLWVNLPKKDKMTKPRYQAILNENIPIVNLPLSGGNPSSAAETDAPIATARIIAGELGTTRGAAKTFSPVQLWDIEIPMAGMDLELPFPSHHNCIIFARRGSVDVFSGEVANLKATTLNPQDVALMQMDGVSDTIRIKSKERNASVLILGGEPLNEPIAAQGPFVMNTKEEIAQAITDYRMGKMGR